MSQIRSELYQIDIKSGVRTKILDECMGEYGDFLGPMSLASRIYYDAVENNIYINSDTVLKFNLDESTCKVAKGGYVGPRTWSVIVNNKGQLFWISF